MSWADRQHKKMQIEKIVRQTMNDPRYKAEMRKMQEEATKQAFDAFLLIGADYLTRHFRCKKEGLLNFIDFVVTQMHYVEEDPEYFKLLNDALFDETGVNILENIVKKQ